MIETLFGSKTRVKLLHLFLNNPGRSFYVREITRIIDEQINSVRRELSNMLNVGIILSDSSDNKLYYSVNTKYEYYAPLSEIFNPSFQKDASSNQLDANEADFYDAFRRIHGLKVAIAAGTLVKDSRSDVDLLLAGSIATDKVKKLIGEIEKSEHLDIRYSLMSYDEFYYRLSVRDRFITDVLNNRHNVILDTEGIVS